MWQIIGIVGSTLIIAYLEIPRLFHKKLSKELVIYSILLLTGTVLGIINAMHVTIANPVKLIIYIHKPFVDLLEALLK